jgi:hypothetical protein
LYHEHVDLKNKALGGQKLKKRKIIQAGHAATTVNSSKTEPGQ